MSLSKLKPLASLFHISVVRGQKESTVHYILLHVVCIHVVCTQYVCVICIHHLWYIYIYWGIFRVKFRQMFLL